VSNPLSATFQSIRMGDPAPAAKIIGAPYSSKCCVGIGSGPATYLLSDPSHLSLPLSIRSRTQPPVLPEPNLAECSPVWQPTRRNASEVQVA